MEETKFYGEYQLSKEMLMDGYTEYQKVMVGKRNLIYSIIYIVLGLYFLFLGIFREENRFCFVIAFVAIAIGCITWYNPRRAKRSVEEVFDEIIGDSYSCDVSENLVIISTQKLADTAEDATDEEIEEAKASGNEGISSSRFPLDEKAIVIEKSEYFVIGNKTIFYVLPKSGFENPEELKAFLKEKCGSNKKSKFEI